MLRPHYPLKLLCETLDCNRSTFYYGPDKKDDDEPIRRAIERVLVDWPTYGYRRVTGRLRRQGRQVNHKKVLRLMREMGLTERGRIPNVD